MLACLYYAMIGFLFTHELDAIKRHEWRVLPLTSFLPEKIGEQVFIWSHVPLFWALLYFDTGLDTNWVRFGLSVFAVVHVGLHWIFRKHPRYEFNNPSSWSLITGAGLFGVLYLLALKANS